MTRIKGYQVVPAREPAASLLRVKPCVMGHSGCGQCCSSQSRHAVSPASLVVAVSRSMISSNSVSRACCWRRNGCANSSNALRLAAHRISCERRLPAADRVRAGDKPGFEVLPLTAFDQTSAHELVDQTNAPGMTRRREEHRSKKCNALSGVVSDGDQGRGCLAAYSQFRLHQFHHLVMNSDDHRAQQVETSAIQHLQHSSRGRAADAQPRMVIFSPL